MDYGSGESGLTKALGALEASFKASFKQTGCTGVSHSGGHCVFSTVLTTVCTGTTFWVSDFLANIPWALSCWYSQDIFNNLQKD